MEKTVTLKVDNHLFKSTVDVETDVKVDDMVGFGFDQNSLHFFDKDSDRNLFCN
ncbi:MAG: hypothetical protein P8017_03565 [Deltaproteobacteria bacterium]